MALKAGRTNSLTDIEGLLVGNADDRAVRSGVTAVICPPGTVASVQVLGGAPGTRETDALDPVAGLQHVDAVVLSGGSAFGLDAASGVQAWLRERGRGFPVGDVRVPIVPAAILFDLTNGGDKGWGRYPPYRELGHAAAAAASGDFALGSAGAGHGALTAGLKGGLGSASTMLADGTTVAALVAVNSVGAAHVASTRHFWAAAHEFGDEFGGLGLPHPLPAGRYDIPLKFRELQRGGANTTIGIIATDAALSKAEVKRLAIAAHDGYARAIWPSHTPLDGDLVFALATGSGGAPDGPVGLTDLCAVAAMTMARAIARGVHAATPAPGDIMPAWSELP
ncbi:MAG: P1 family peptidase [Rhizobiaceae bacterium]